MPCWWCRALPPASVDMQSNPSHPTTPFPHPPRPPPPPTTTVPPFTHSSLASPPLPHPPPGQVTALGLPALLERVSNALVATTDLFRQFDTGGDGFIDHEEFARVYQDLFVDGSAERIDNVRVVT